MSETVRYVEWNSVPIKSCPSIVPQRQNLPYRLVEIAPKRPSRSLLYVLFKMKISRAAVRRFIYFVRGIEPAKVHLHQTLTCNPPAFDGLVAKKRIKRLLDNLHKRFQMASIYVMEAHQSGAWHFHVLFLFYPENDLPCAPSRLNIDFRRDILTAWQRLQTGKVNPKANETNEVGEISLGYLLKSVEIAKPSEKLPRARFRWWEAWNQELLRRHKQPLDKEAAKRDFPGWKPKAKRRRAGKTSVPREPYLRRDMLRERGHVEAWLEARGRGPDWETWKRQKTGRDKKVSDADFILFQNGRAPWIKKRKKKKDARLDDDLPF